MAKRAPIIVAIGASAGGIAAITALLTELPINIEAVVLIAIHRPISTESHLAEVLSWRTGKSVRVAREGMLLECPSYLVAPSDRHMAVGPDSRIRLVRDGFYRGNNIDLLFNSLARCAGPRTIGVLLSGLLKDGTEGLRAITEAGGIALVQAPLEAEYPDMPNNAITEDGIVDLVAPTRGLAEAIKRVVSRSMPLASLRAQ